MNSSWHQRKHSVEKYVTDEKTMQKNENIDIFLLSHKVKKIPIYRQKNTIIF